MGKRPGEVVDGGQLVRVEGLQVVESRPKSLHLFADGLIPPAPRSDDDEVGAVAHHRPRVEQSLEVLARLDGADEEDESLGNMEPGSCLLELIPRHRAESSRDPMRHDLDPPTVDAEELDDVAS